MFFLKGKFYRTVAKVAMEKITHFLKSHVRFSDDGWTPLHSASETGDLEKVKRLLEKGAGINTVDIDGWTPLNLAIMAKHWEVVKLLLEKGVYIQDKEGNEEVTALELAVGGGHLEIAKLLLEKGADVNAGDINGNTPLSVITDSEMIKFLLANGANIEAQNKYSETALHQAIDNLKRFGHNRSQVVKLLLANGANIDAQDKKGFTALHRAIRYGLLEVAKLLLEKGANTEVKNNKGQTPFDIVKKKSNQEMIALFENK